MKIYIPKMSVLSKLPVMMSDEDVVDPRYEKCKMYLLRHTEDVNNTNVYVGHTIGTLQSRWSQHIWDLKNKVARKKSQYINENGGVDNWEIVLIEEYPCKNFHHATKKEQEWVRKFSNTLNSNIPGRDLVQYRNENREQLRKEYREFYENNKEKRLKKSAEYNRRNKDYRNRQIECECGEMISWSNAARHRQTQNHLDRMELLNI
tara:strand:+ start:1514 stop:2128 length:615 start_codon:yes stop_codon:yes gene_type:complete